MQIPAEHFHHSRLHFGARQHPALKHVRVELHFGFSEVRARGGPANVVLEHLHRSVELCRQLRILLKVLPYGRRELLQKAGTHVYVVRRPAVEEPGGERLQRPHLRDNRHQLLGALFVLRHNRVLAPVLHQPLPRSGDLQTFLAQPKTAVLVRLVPLGLGLLVPEFLSELLDLISRSGQRVLFFQVLKHSRGIRPHDEDGALGEVPAARVLDHGAHLGVIHQHLKNGPGLFVLLRAFGDGCGLQVRHRPVIGVEVCRGALLAHAHTF